MKDITTTPRKRVMIKLTDRQSEILDYIKRHIADTGFPPTRADIAKELGFFKD